MPKPAFVLRYLCAGAVIALAVAPAAAQDVRGQLSRCLGIPGVLQRLACYDGVARAAGAVASASPPAAGFGASPPPARPPAPLPVPRYAAPSVQLGDERLPQALAAESASPGRLMMGIAKFETSVRGRFVLTLTNGQVWRQIDGDTAIARPRASARSVLIEKAVFGSYSLTFNDSVQLYKVTRVQ